MLEDGHCDDSFVKSVLAELVDYNKIIICKSTVPPGVYAYLESKYPNIVVDASAEGARKQGGKRIELEDLLATGHGGILPFNLPSCTKYVPMLWPELRDREMFGWFLRMDERQIMQSDTSVKYLLARSL